MNKQSEIQLGDLKARVVGSEKAAGPVVVLMHGFGAPGTDLVGLANVLDGTEGTRFVFPEAPLALGDGYGMGRAWWLIDIARLQQALAMGSVRNMVDEVPDGLEEAQTKLHGCLEALTTTMRPTKLVIGGFSQGAMLAIDTVLRGRFSFAALLVFSGTIIAKSRWQPRFPVTKELPVMVSHGRSDPVLPYAVSNELQTLFENAGADVMFTPFQGGHEIPRIALEAANKTLAKALR
ncbi:MAG: phospholipase [Myxococcales bacterium]|nr:phospholipase [Myxococcales bacterium]